MARYTPLPLSGIEPRLSSVQPMVIPNEETFKETDVLYVPNKSCVDL
jgi:hypothetical protein